VPHHAGCEGGWLRVAPPAQFGVSVAHGWAERMVEPLPGRLVLMPGYFYHETLPTLSDEMRVCVAFNIVPQELGSAPPGSTGYRADAPSPASRLLKRSPDGAVE
jgi:hypothetical protein